MCDRLIICIILYARYDIHHNLLAFCAVIRLWILRIPLKIRSSINNGIGRFRSRGHDFIFGAFGSVQFRITGLLALDHDLIGDDVTGYQTTFNRFTFLRFAFLRFAFLGFAFLGFTFLGRTFVRLVLTGFASIGLFGRSSCNRGIITVSTLSCIAGHSDHGQQHCQTQQYRHKSLERVYAFLFHTILLHFTARVFLQYHICDTSRVY